MLKKFRDFLHESDSSFKGKDGKQYSVHHSEVSDNARFGRGVKVNKYAVHHNGKEVGHALMHQGAKGVINVHVEPSHRRNHIATHLYNHIEKHVGHKVKPTSIVSDEGEAFWNHRKKS